MQPSALHPFHPLIRTWFRERFDTPTDVQEGSWRAIGEGLHVLLTAPTTSGKTLAAFLLAINQLLTRDFNPLKTIAIDSINGAFPPRSEYLGNMRDYGFTASHRGLILHKNR